MLLWLPALMLFGCGKEPGPTESCSPLSVVDGYVSVKVKTLEGDLTLRLPEYAHIVREPARGCQFTSHVSIDYLWHQGKLISETANRFKVPADKHIKVRLGLSVNGQHKLVENMPMPPESWRYEPALRHKYFPLAYYPRFNWGTKAGAKYEFQNSGSWGILNTKYKTTNDNKPFTAICSMVPLYSSQQDSIVEGVFAEYGDSKCRGRITAVKNGKVLAGGIDVWAPGAQEINHIYDAAVEQLQNFIQK